VTGRLDSCATAVQGALQGSEAWCLHDTTSGSGTPLDLGPASVLSAQAAHDYDGDGTRETNAEELTGLVGTKVTLLVTETAGTPGSYAVYTIDTLDYRLADGTFR
jgi:hypothetical protein